MKIRSDFHVHTTFCDGKDTPAEMAETAYELGFHTLGFSSHGLDEANLEICMDEARAANYRREIRALKDRYAGRMRILCGMEMDYHSTVSGEGYDYLIGSVHNLLVDGKYHVIDHTAEEFLTVVNDCFHGDFDLLAEVYYAQAADVLRKTKADIIGHLDLLTKFHEKLCLTESSRYLRAAYEAIHTLVPYGKPFEINVGAIARGYRTRPYPSELLLREIHRCGGMILFSGDCHDRRFLGKYFDDAVELAKACGFTEYVDWGDNGFTLFPLDD